jgi:hypothetical protein
MGRRVFCPHTETFSYGDKVLFDAIFFETGVLGDGPVE